MKCYSHELHSTGVLNKFCSIITETELRSYSTFMNNCQTPVAAFIYTLCDTFRPYSEALYTKHNFLQEARDHLEVVRETEAYSLQPEYSLSLLKRMRQSNIQNLSDIPLTAVPMQLLSRPLDVFLKFGCTANLMMMGLNMVQPSDLDVNLDYFGFYGDQLSNEYLKMIQKLDGQADVKKSPSKSPIRRLSR